MKDKHRHAESGDDRDIQGERIEQLAIDMFEAFLRGQASLAITSEPNPTFPNMGLAGGLSIRLRKDG